MARKAKTWRFADFKNKTDTTRFEPVYGHVPGTKQDLVFVLGVRHFVESEEYLGSFFIVRDITAEASLEGKYEVKKNESITDALTGLNNRAFFNDYIKNLEENLKGSSNPLCVAMVDIDFFKKINDVYGHQAGDQALRETAAIMTKTMRGTDMLFRYGGEEFCVVFCETQIQGAILASEKLRQAISKDKYTFQDQIFPVSISIGIAEWIPSEESFAAALGRADSALYYSKQNGRNLVTAHYLIKGFVPHKSAA